MSNNIPRDKLEPGSGHINVINEIMRLHDFYT